MNEFLLTLEIVASIAIVVLLLMYITGHFKCNLSCYDEFEDNTEG